MVTTIAAIEEGGTLPFAALRVAGRTNASAPTQNLCAWLLFGDTFGVAVEALYGVHIVRTFRRSERRVHGLDVDAAIRELRMAGGTRGACGLTVPFVAGEAA